MQIQIYRILAHANQAQLDEMNKFLRGHEIIDVKQDFYTVDGLAYWTVFIRYQGRGQSMPQGKGVKAKVDYRELLDTETFKVFATLREIRKELAMEASVPLYAVFTNKELADIASLSKISIESVKAISGIGEKKLAKYGEELVNRYQKKE